MNYCIGAIILSSMITAIITYAYRAEDVKYSYRHNYRNCLLISKTILIFFINIVLFFVIGFILYTYMNNSYIEHSSTTIHLVNFKNSPNNTTSDKIFINTSSGHSPVNYKIGYLTRENDGTIKINTITNNYLVEFKEDTDIRLITQSTTIKYRLSEIGTFLFNSPKHDEMPYAGTYEFHIPKDSVEGDATIDLK